MTPFHQVLGNNLVANITNFTVWFAITFWVYLETRSVFATGMIAGLRTDGPARDAVVLGRAAWQVATAGFVCTLAGGLWLRRLVR